MVVRRVSFRDFRNLEGETVSFGDGVNVLRGQNAQGKSNVLEGIYLFARGKSFRGVHDREMVRLGCEAGAAELEYLGDGATYPVTLEVRIPKNGKKEYLRGGAKLSGVREMIGNFRAVLFCPAHLSLAGGAPAVRRTWLDVALSQLDAAYLSDLSRYGRLLAQRNALIKDAAAGKTVSTGQWESIGLVMASYGIRVAAARYDYAVRAEEYVKAFFSEMTAGSEEPSLRYETRYLTAGAGDYICGERTDASLRAASEAVLPLYTDSVERELRVGSTLHGIHKDDVAVSINGNDARLYASQGQQRSIALAMKLSEGALSRSLTGEDPVFLLDDVLSELDSSRRAFVLSSLGARQVIITSCDADLFGTLGDVNIIGVENGKIIP